MQKFTAEEMKDQIHAIVCNHKKATIRGVKNITGFSEDFITETLDSFVDAGVFKKTKSYVLEGEVINEVCYRVKKKYLQTDIFGQTESEDYCDNERLTA